MLDQHIQALYNLAHTLVSSDDLKTVLRMTVDSLSDTLQAGRVILAAYDPEKKVITHYITSGSSTTRQKIPSYEEFKHKLSGWELDDKKALVAPLAYHQRTFGVITVLRPPGQTPFSEEDRQLAIAMADQAALAIESARLFTAERQRVDQFDALRATVADISTELELPRLLQSIVERATALLDATGGDVGLYNEDNEEIRIVASHKMGRDYTGTIMGVGEGAMGLAVKTRQPVMIDDYAIWENASPQYQGGIWRAVLAVPFMIGARIVGAIGIVHTHPDRRFTASDQHLLILFAQHAAIAVENANLYQAARQAAERRIILHNVSQEIVTASLDSEGIYKAIHHAVAQLMPAEAFVITQFDESRKEIQAVYLIDRSGRVPQINIPANRGLSGRVIASGKSIYIEDTLDATTLGDVVHFGHPEEVRSALAVPMRLRGKTIGMLSTQSYQPRAYTPDDQSLLEMLASYAAIALDNARLFLDIQQLAITDSLTAIYNRRHLFELGRREFYRARRFNRPLSVIMLDVDHFKEINDAFGHAVGDAVLHKLAQLLKSQTREIDIVGRYGGEEFVIVLTETNLQAAREIAERLRKRIFDTFYVAGEEAIPLTVSMGIASISLKTPHFPSIIARADNALYAAKQGGRNRVEMITDN
jgi:diguanylate cyclase (GGDEF)-like protein